MAKKKIAISPARFVKLAKRLGKMRPGSAAAKKLRPLVESELSQIVVHGGAAAARRAIKGVKTGAHRFEKAQQKGRIAKWRTTIGLGMQALEIWILLSKLRPGALVNVVRTKRPPAKRRGRKRAKVPAMP